MIPKKYLVEIGTYTICKKGKAAFTLAAPRAWLIYSGAQLGDECTALTDKRDNSLHYYLKAKSRRSA
jgi:hypothetical protein